MYCSVLQCVAGPTVNLDTCKERSLPLVLHDTSMVPDKTMYMFCAHVPCVTMISLLTHTYAQAHARTHVQTTRTYTHKHTHTHTQTQA